MTASKVGSRSGDCVSVIEAAYRTDLDLGEWLRGIAEAALPILDGGSGVTVYPLEIDEIGYHIPDTQFAGMPRELHDMWRSASFVPDERGGFRPVGDDQSHLPLVFGNVPRVVSLREQMRRWPQLEHHEVMRETVVRIGDACAVAGMNHDGRGLVLATIVPDGWRLPPARHQLLARVAAHLAAAHRLRRADFAFRAPAFAPEVIFEERGRLQHFDFDESCAEEQRADAVARGRPARFEAEAFARSLEKAAQDLLRARSTLRREPEAAVAELWTGLLAGRWSVVDRRDSDGKRFLFAIRNPPGSRDPWALNAREREIARLSAAGHDLKFVAYELGLSPSTVHGYLASALRKLGCDNVADLGNIFGPPAPTGGS
jgi:DNA-binding CsgD family transcriptional regulator